ncbi:MAG TPA: MT-A70 family methyltransferase [Stellaceae bacterium]|nr:MT-A70 family methyltransferase [Stellaceae bacterium]
MSEWPFGSLQCGHYGAILADPPWHFQSWTTPRWNGGHHVQTPAKAPPYDAMNLDEIESLPVAELAAPDCTLFMWGIWVMLPHALRVIESWGFEYKTAAFVWTKANVRQIDLFRDDADGQLGLGYWVRQNTEFCFLATRGKPKRLHADVRQGIIAPRREHSRKPDGIHARIERLVAGPYVELFARQRRPGWDTWGNQTDKFPEAAE